MEVRSEKANEKSLNDLPSSQDDYWEHSEVYLREMKEPDKHEHVFKYLNSREIICKCGMGLFIGEGDELRGGHLYHNNKLVL